MSGTGVTVVATHVRPAKGYGGVAESVYNLCTAWARQHRPFRLCVSDASADGTISVAAIGLPEQIPVDLFHAVLFKRWGFGPGAIGLILSACRQAKAVYVCGIATWPTTLAALVCVVLRRPFVVAVRGGLMPRQIELIRAAKPAKWLYYRLLTLPTLRFATFIHVTSDIEAEGVRALLGEVDCRVIPNGLDLAVWNAAPIRREHGLTFCFVGRLSREKGIKRFLRCWLAGRRQGERFIVVGDGDGEYAAQIRALADGSNGDIEMTGTLPEDQVRAVIARADFLILPSGIEQQDVRENFGNTVAESLASGRPVLVSRGLAWDFIEAEGLGVLFEPSEDSITVALDRARAVPRDAYLRMSRAARLYAERSLDINVTAERLWSLLPLPKDGPS